MNSNLYPDLAFRSLYRRSLKLALDWAVHRHVWRGQAVYIRSLFEANRDVRDPRQQKVMDIFPEDQDGSKLLTSELPDPIPRDREAFRGVETSRSPTGTFFPRWYVSFHLSHPILNIV